MISISTAECFTHGILAREIHCLSQGYKDNFKSDYLDLVKQIEKECLDDKKSDTVYDLNDLSLRYGLFIPTLDAVKSILNIKDPVKPLKLIKGIKVYDDEGDKEMSIMMAEACRKISNTSIGIGTTAGIGYGGIAIVDEDFIISTSSDVKANLMEDNYNNLYLRQISGIEKTLKILIYYLNNNFDKIHSLNNVNIIRK